MIKKGSLLLIVLLLSLPACWQKKEKKASQPKKSKEMAMVTENAPEELELADADLERFFSELGEFEVADADGEDYRREEFAWSDADADYRIDPVYFAFNSAEVQEDQIEQVRSSADKAKQLLAEAQADGFEAKLMVDGYACKSAGSAEYNKSISEKRAQRVAEQLVASGIKSEDVQVRGLGSTNLVVEDGSREEQKPNRRVEMHVIYS